MNGRHFCIRIYTTAVAPFVIACHNYGVQLSGLPTKPEPVQLV